MEWLVDFFSKLSDLPALIRLCGYVGLVVIIFSETGLLAGFFLPGDSLLITAGLLCSMDETMNFYVLNLLLSLAAILGDSTGYFIGYHLGPKLFNKDDSVFFHKDHLVRTQKFYEKHGPKTIVLARFVPIIRTFAPTIAGAAKMDYKKFFFFNFFGGILWVVSMTSIGFFLGNSIPNIEKQLHIIIILVVVISFVPILKESLQIVKNKKEPV